ncbi:MAG: hypothetical protein P8L22_01515 [Acidimicrobiales bacterium]|nr:hypothetical protein [Acidimicrobiales bacterium]
MKNKTTKIITFIGIVALSLSALFVSIGSASSGNPFGANPPGFFEPIPEIPIELIVDVNEPTVQYDNTCIPFHEVDIMITNNSVGLDQEFSVYIVPEDQENESAVPLYADNHVEVTSMTSVVVSFDGDQSDNVDLNLLVYLNPMNLDNPLLDVSINECPFIVLWPIPDGVGEPVEGNDDEGDEEEAPVLVEGNDEGNTPDIEEIGYPPEPEVAPEDPKGTDDSDETASSEAEETQGSSGLSFLWIILIIVGGVATIGTTTRAIQKTTAKH